jgi:hypothetical protein
MSGINDPDLVMHDRIVTWLEALEANYVNMYARQGQTPTARLTFECDAPRKGQRYVRIIMCRDGRRDSVHAFYDQRNGDVYKAAGWKKPAAIVRFNLLDDDSFATMIERADWTGGYLYLR